MKTLTDINLNLFELDLKPKKGMKNSNIQGERNQNMVEDPARRKRKIKKMIEEVDELISRCSLL